MLRRDRAMTALSLMLDIAFHAGRAGIAPAAEIADRLGLARRGMEPLLQMLARAGLLDSVRGPRGGYRLARPPREIGLAAILTAVQQGAEEGQDAHGPSGTLHRTVIEPLWRGLEAVLQAELAALTLEDLLRRAAAAGMTRPPLGPITFAI